jgi:hypothetical protein
LPDALRDEITFFGHIIQGNRITIKTDDMKVLNPDEDEIFEITITRVLPPKSEDPEYMLLLFLHKHDVKGDTFRREDLSDSMVADLSRATVALHQDPKLSEILRMKLERLRQ